MRILITSFLLLGTTLASCNLSGVEEDQPDLVATWVATTLTAMYSPPPIPSATLNDIGIATSTPLASATETAQPSNTPQNPLVLETILCWKGPGPQFEVVSALKKDERVELLARASISGWVIVDNPIYHDPCWAQAEYLKIDTGYNTFALPVYTPPPTPTSTPSNTPTPTITPTNTP